ncbi:NAD(P)-binding protein [Ochrobactrum cytisi]|nr:NAD(P)-binding protein [Brucella cytisi]
MVDLAIVGAGPAGMAAALEVADAGFSVLVVDEQASAGGQIFRRPRLNGASAMETTVLIRGHET